MSAKNLTQDPSVHEDASGCYQRSTLREIAKYRAKGWRQLLGGIFLCGGSFLIWAISLPKLFDANAVPYLFCSGGIVTLLLLAWWFWSSWLYFCEARRLRENMERTLWRTKKSVFDREFCQWKVDMCRKRGKDVLKYGGFTLPVVAFSASAYAWFARSSMEELYANEMLIAIVCLVCLGFWFKYARKCFLNAGILERATESISRGYNKEKLSSRIFLLRREVVRKRFVLWTSVLIGGLVLLNGRILLENLSLKRSTLVIICYIVLIISCSVLSRFLREEVTELREGEAVFELDQGDQS